MSNCRWRSATLTAKLESDPANVQIVRTLGGFWSPPRRPLVMDVGWLGGSHGPQGFVRRPDVIAVVEPRTSWP